MTSLFGLSLPDLVEAAGHLGLFAIVFAESGMPFGFLFPGDSLLFTAGLVASQGYLNIVILAPLLVLAAILGDSAGYWIGSYLGTHIASEKRFLFKKEYIDRTSAFYAKYGARAIVLGRFMPVIRSFVPILAGAGGMRYRTFLFYNILGAIIWGGGITLAGYWLGAAIPDAEQYLLPIIGIIIFVSFLPLIIELVRHRKKQA
jgi:membrane-associated protein